MSERDQDSTHPWQLREWELTEAEFEALYRIAKDPDSKVGRLNWTPRRIPWRKDGQP